MGTEIVITRKTIVIPDASILILAFKRYNLYIEAAGTCSQNFIWERGVVFNTYVRHK